MCSLFGLIFLQTHCCYPSIYHCNRNNTLSYLCFQSDIIYMCARFLPTLVLFSFPQIKLLLIFFSLPLISKFIFVAVSRVQSVSLVCAPIMPPAKPAIIQPELVGLRILQWLWSLPLVRLGYLKWFSWLPWELISLQLRPTDCPTSTSTFDLLLVHL